MAEVDRLDVALIMGSASDWEIMRNTADMLSDFGVANESRVLSAHRTPNPLEAYIIDAENRGCKVFIGAAGGAAHLAGVIASKTVKPVFGVPMPSAIQGIDSLLSTVQMPAGIPVGTLAIGKAGAINAALLAIAVLAIELPELREKLLAYREKQAEKIINETLT